MAVGIIIGTAFGKIVTSLVTDIIMPPLGWLTGGVDFSNMKVILKSGVTASDTVTINYGNFINTIINFAIITFSIFFIIKQISNIRERINHRLGKEKKDEQAPLSDKEISTEKHKELMEQTKLLREIRDNLKK